MKAAPYLPDPPPEERQRDPGIVPAFLKPLSSSQPDTLPALITILNTIPAFQNAILGRQSENYGYNADWWQGNTSRDMGLVETEVNEVTQRFALLHESQRLVGLLEHSHRLYGNAASLAAILSSLSSSAPLGTTYLRALDEALAANERDIICSNGSFFRSSYTRPVPEDDAFSMLLHPPDTDPVPQENLYDALDDCLYSTELLFAQTAPVITITLSKRSPLQIPCDLLLDRYHVVNDGKIRQLIQQRSEKREQYQLLQSQKQKLETFAKPRGGDDGDAGKLMEASLDLLNKRASIVTQAGRTQANDKDMLHMALMKVSENIAKQKTGKPQPSARRVFS